MMMQRKILSESKDEIAIVLFGTEGTLNDLDDKENYKNISVLHPLCQPTFGAMKIVADIKPGPEETDFLDALVVGLDILHQNAQGKKIEYRRLVLFTNFDHQFSNDNLDQIIQGFLSESNVQLNVISPQFEDSICPDADNDDDASTNNDDSDGEGPSSKRPKQDNRQTLSSKPKTPQQRAGERLISHIFSEGVEGCAYSYEQAVVALTGFEKKSVRSAAWKCNLTIGQDLTIPCSAFVKTKASTLKKTWTKVYAKTGKAEDIMQQKYYVLQSDDQVEVDEESLGKGYKYGRDIVPFSKIDEEQMKYKTEGKCLSVLGFTDLRNILIQDLMEDQAHYVMPEKEDPAAQSALNSLITALQNMKMCAVARYVYRKGTNPKLVALLPKVKDGVKCLVMVSLPFAEDVRTLDFPGIDSQQSDTPDEEQLAAIDQLITSMDLCQGDEELFSPKKTLNPYFQWVYHNLSHRALNPESSMPPLDDRIANIMARNENIRQQSELAAQRVERSFPLVKQEEKRRKFTGKELWADIDLDKLKKENEASTAGGDATSDLLANLFREPDVQSVGSVTPVQDFIALLKSKSEDKIKLIFEQMKRRVLEFVLDTFNLGSTKVLPCIKIMREQAVQKNQEELFNSFLKQLKEMLLSKNAPHRRRYWDDIVSSDISLIVGHDATEDESRQFLTEQMLESISHSADDSDDGAVDAEDLLNEL